MPNDQQPTMTGDTLREAVARALVSKDSRDKGQEDLLWHIYLRDADAALRAIVRAAGLDAEGLGHGAAALDVLRTTGARWDWANEREVNAAALLRALASAAEPKP